jgi:hypothetical protein
MRTLLAVGLLAALASPALAQDAEASGPDPQSTYVVPAHPGEAVRITVYAERPTGTGRLAQRYRGLRIQRTAPVAASAAPARVVQPVTETPRAAFVRRAGSYFQVLPAR